MPKFYTPDVQGLLINVNKSRNKGKFRKTAILLSYTLWKYYIEKLHNSTDGLETSFWERKSSATPVWRMRTSALFSLLNVEQSQYGFGMVYSGAIVITSFVKISQVVQKFEWTYRHTDSTLISYAYFYPL